MPKEKTKTKKDKNGNRRKTLHRPYTVQRPIITRLYKMNAF